MSAILARLREHFDDWQAEVYEKRPADYDSKIDRKINALTNVELLETICYIYE